MFTRSVCAKTVATLVLALAPQFAGAATVTLNLATPGTSQLGVGESAQYTLGGDATTKGLTVTLTGMSYAGGEISTSGSGASRAITGYDTKASQSALNFSNAGAGISNPKEWWGIPGIFVWDFDSAGADTTNYADFFVITLSQTATLQAADFTDNYTSGGAHPKSKSSFVWASDTTGDGAIGNGDRISAPVKLSDAPYNFNGTSSTAFLIGASGNKSDWMLKSLTLSYTPIEISAVPLPASGLMLTGALAGFGLMRRRRKTA